MAGTDSSVPPGGGEGWPPWVRYAEAVGVCLESHRDCLVCHAAHPFRAYVVEMSETGKDRVGTMRDWPGKVLAAGVVLALLGVVFRGATGTLLVLLAVALLAFGGFSLMIRRGAFTPRR